jgi:hypothetical protein
MRLAETVFCGCISLKLAVTNSALRRTSFENLTSFEINERRRREDVTEEPLRFDGVWSPRANLFPVQG